jgi:hypothetical protein
MDNKGVYYSYIYIYIVQLIGVLGSPAIGERFSPAKDCSDVADNLGNAVNGFYWIKLPNGKVKQVN